jgi:hypothetical protein
MDRQKILFIHTDFILKKLMAIFPGYWGKIFGKIVEALFAFFIKEGQKK